MLYYTDNPIADFNRHDRERAAEEAKLPRCHDCGEPIFDEYYEFDGRKICTSCIEEYRCEVEL